MAQDDGVDEELQAAMRLGATAVAALRERRAREVQAQARQAEGQSQREAAQGTARAGATERVASAGNPGRASADMRMAQDQARGLLEQQYGKDWASREDLPAVLQVTTHLRESEQYHQVPVPDLVAAEKEAQRRRAAATAEALLNTDRRSRDVQVPARDADTPIPRLRPEPEQEGDLPLVMPPREVLHPEMKPLLEHQRAQDVASGRPPVPLEWISPQDVEKNPALQDQWTQQQIESGMLSPNVEDLARRGLEARRAGLPAEAVTAVQLAEQAQRTPGSAAVASRPQGAPRARKFLGRGGGKGQERTR